MLASFSRYDILEGGWKAEKMCRGSLYTFDSSIPGEKDGRSLKHSIGVAEEEEYITFPVQLKETPLGPTIENA